MTLIDELKRMRVEWDRALAEFEHNPVLYLLHRYVETKHSPRPLALRCP